MPYATAPVSVEDPRTLLRHLPWFLLLLLVSACGTSSRTTTDGGSGWGRKGGTGTAVPAAATNEAPAPPTTTEAAALKARVYDAMARMSRAQAAGDAAAAEAALDAAMGDVRLLFQSETAMQAPELRELYRSVVTAYEQYYGVSDTLTTEYGDIFAFREAMFSTLNDLRDPLLEDVMLPPVRVPAGAVALDRNHLVEQSIRYLAREPERHLYNWMSRSATYFPMIEQILREEGVPDELKYLAMVESALNPRARSRVGASGLWQFMPATGREYGLQVTHWVDERWDPEKSTRAAARYLRDLYKQFGDWHLAMAAYNCGPGRVARAKKQFEAGGGKARFWDIYERLPRETRNYVPMFIAAAIVSSDPAAFDLRTPQPGPRYTFDVVAVEGSIDLQTAAGLAGTSVDVIRALNPEIRQWMTPPSRVPYRLRVPAGAGKPFEAAFAALSPDEKRGSSEYRVRHGDTLGRIARRYGTTVSALQSMNGLDGSLIREGQVLYVPASRDAYTGAELASAGTTAYDTPARPAAYSTPAPSPAPAARASSRTTNGSTRVHYRVQRGDNLSGIAARYDVSVADLKAWNDLPDDHIRSGQMLALYPGGNAPARTTAQRTGTRKENTRKGWTPHYVRSGENLTTIARRYGATVAEVKKWNDLSGDALQVGQRLAIYVR